eukprot:TRINITY_DN100508_c0_g1_i1.p1 TRINITY_DN100508_c0_g1~~TRINITY_DN100508_c0_g1_i1.p1  ORF type:complete len:228 (-),score=44.96 TRINITY_DN100508_c0_g1_i1:118-780(-)
MLARTLCSVSRTSRLSRVVTPFSRPIFAARHSSTLSSILEREIQQEESNTEITEPPRPAHFKIHEAPGSVLVKATRTVKGEDITVQYTVPKDLAVDENEQTVIPVDIIVRKAGRGGLEFQCTVEHQDGSPVLIVQRFAHFDEAHAATLVDETAEADYQRDLRYGGPLLADLESDLQEAIAEFLEQRGVNDDIAVWVWDHVRVKENKEYVRWMKGIQNFLS